MFRGQQRNPVCPNCGRAASQDAQFCPYCGNRTYADPGFCPNCGAGVTPEDAFCASCGAATAASAANAIGPDAIAVTRLEYMGFWIRLVAWLIDNVVLLVPSLLAELVLPFWGPAIVGTLYSVLFIGLKGQTPGKMAMGVQVVDERGNIPGIGRAVLREIIGKFVSTLVVFLGFFWVGWDRRKRGWHDYISATYVIRKPPNRH